MEIHCWMTRREKQKDTHPGGVPDKRANAGLGRGAAGATGASVIGPNGSHFEGSKTELRGRRGGRRWGTLLERSWWSSGEGGGVGREAGTSARRQGGAGRGADGVAGTGRTLDSKSQEGGKGGTSGSLW